MSLSRTVSVLNNVKALNNGVTLKLWPGVVQGHWKWRHSINHVWLISSLPLYNYSSISLTIFEIKRDIGQKSQFFIPLHSAPVRILSYHLLRQTIMVHVATRWWKKF